LETLQSALLQAGVAGVVLGWFMLRAERKWDDQAESQSLVEAAINRLAKAQLMLLLASDSTPPSVKLQAQELDKEIEGAETERRSRGGRSGARAS
jgi:hypothetical protein